MTSDISNGNEYDLHFNDISKQLCLTSHYLRDRSMHFNAILISSLPKDVLSTGFFFYFYAQDLPMKGLAL